MTVDLEHLFHRRYRPMVRLATWLLGDRGGAEEVVQDALLRLSRRPDDAPTIASPDAYLRSAVVNICHSRPAAVAAPLGRRPRGAEIDRHHVGPAGHRRCRAHDGGLRHQRGRPRPLRRRRTPLPARHLTEPTAVIDPQGYNQYSEEEVAASKAWGACMTEGRAGLDLAGLTSAANLAYGPLLVLAGAGAALMLFSGWVGVWIAGPIERRRRRVLLVLTLVAVLSAGFQLTRMETIAVITELTE